MECHNATEFPVVRSNVNMILVLLVCWSIILLCLLGCEKVRKSIKRGSFSWRIRIAIIGAINLINASAIVFILAIVERGNIQNVMEWISMYPCAVIIEIVFLFFLLNVVATIANYAHISVLIIGVVCFISVTINFYLLQLRNEYFTPTLLTMGGEAAQIVDLSALPFSSEIFYALILLVFLVVINFYMFSNNGKIYQCKQRKYNVCVALGCLSLYLIGVVFNGNIVQISQYSVANAYNQYGVVVSFTKYASMNKIVAPKGYSKERIQEIVDKYGLEKKINQEKKPNIIMIMSESFWNPQILEDIEFENYNLDTIEQLEESAISGTVFSPTYGGGTCNVEFEALTSMSMKFIQNNAFPYETIIKRNFYSYPNFLHELGYYTTAMHPNSPNFYNRANAYKYMGFDSFLSVSDFNSSKSARGFVSDAELTTRIIQEYENLDNKKSPWFAFAVSIQNHHPYGKNDNANIELNGEKLTEKVETPLKDFAWGIKKSDEALGELIAYFEKEDDPTIIIFWGDHMVNIGKTDYQAFIEGGYLTDKEDPEAKHKTYLTPIYVWDNYMHNNINLAEISTFQILPTITDVYGLDAPAYMDFLNELSEYSTGITSNGVLNVEGEFCEKMTEDQEQAYLDMELLQYDYIYGEQYAKSIFLP